MNSTPRASWAMMAAVPGVAPPFLAFHLLISSCSREHTATGCSSRRRRVGLGVGVAAVAPEAPAASEPSSPLPPLRPQVLDQAGVPLAQVGEDQALAVEHSVQAKVSGFFNGHNGASTGAGRRLLAGTEGSCAEAATSSSSAPASAPSSAPASSSVRRGGHRRGAVDAGTAAHTDLHPLGLGREGVGAPAHHENHGRTSTAVWSQH